MNICIVDDNQTLLDNLKLLLGGEPDMVVTGAFTSAEAALDCVAWEQVDVLLADIDLPGISGVDLIRHVKPSHPGLDALAYTIFEDRGVVMSAIKAGASGYLLKGSTPRILIESLRELHEGGAPMTPRIARKLIAELQLQSGRAPAVEGPEGDLTAREIAILKLIEKGLSYSEIGDCLHISTHTVHSHIKKIYGKVHAGSRPDMLRKARRLGVI